MVVGNGTGVVDTAIMYSSRLKLGKYYRSKDTVANNFQPFASYMVNKKWWLEEEFNTHLLRFQQVTSTQFYILIDSNINIFYHPRLG